MPDNRKPLRLKVAVKEETGSIREKLLKILRWDELALITITLRNGKEITLPLEDEDSPTGQLETTEKQKLENQYRPEYRVSVGQDYLEIDIAPTSVVSIYDVVPLSEIVNIQYF